MSICQTFQIPAVSISINAFGFSTLDLTMKLDNDSRLSKKILAAAAQVADEEATEVLINWLWERAYADEERGYAYAHTPRGVIVSIQFVEGLKKHG